MTRTESTGAEHTIRSISRQTRRSVNSAGPRYTPNLAPGAPNLLVQSIVEPLSALADSPEWRDECIKEAIDAAKAFRDLAHLSTKPERDEIDGATRLTELLGRSATLTPIRAAGALGAMRELLPAVQTMLRRLDDANPQRHDVKNDDPAEERSQAERNSSLLFEARAAYRALENLLSASGTQAFERGHLLLVGDWGTGKTHSVCDLSLRRIANDRHTLLLLAKDFSGATPLKEVLEALGVPRLRNLLASLNRLGRAIRSRTLVIVDGINEGNRDGWARACKTLLTESARFQWVGIVLTCRSPFEHLMFSGDELQRIPHVVHPGFQDAEFDAQKSFFAFYNLPLPEVPLLADEFSRPLTLKLICEAFKDLKQTTKKKGISGIASGQKSMTFVFERFVDAVAADLEGQLNLQSKFSWRFLKDADGIAALMVREGREWVTKSEVLDVLSRRLTDRTVAQRREVLTRMLGAGVLLEDRRWIGSAWQAIIRLPYQRFSDHLIARHLLERHLPNPLRGAAIRAAFRPDAPIGQLFADVDADARRIGWLEALIVEFPERLKRLKGQRRREVYDFLPTDVRDIARYFEPFVRGLPWRSVSSFSSTTDALIVDLLNGRAGGDTSWRTLETVLSLAIRPDHPWASKRIWKALMSLPLVERDLYWSEFLRRRDRNGAIERLLAWTERAETVDVSASVAGEMARVLSLVLTSTDVPLRDRATRALVKLGESQPLVLARQVRSCFDVNDAYMTERMLSAFYGVAMSKWAAASAKPLHRQLVSLARQLMKETAEPAGKLRTPHALIRDHVNGIVELASLRSSRVRADLERWRQASQRETIDPFIGINYAKKRLEDAKGAIRMDFENYTLGSLVRNRSNYDMKHRRYRRVRRLVLARVADLGWSQSLFKDPDREIGSGSLSRSVEPNRVERYGKKYSWTAYFEMYGLQSLRRRLPDWREPRPSDCGPDPSFPSGPEAWRLPLEHAFADAARSATEWLADGEVPDYSKLVLLDEIGGHRGPWVLLDGYTNHRAGDKREIFAFLRGLLATPKRLARVRTNFLQVDYPGNSKIPDSGEDHYTYAGEVPWSAKFGVFLRNGSGTARRQIVSMFDEWRQTGTQMIAIGGEPAFESPVGVSVPGPRVELPAYRSGWESYHSVTTPGYGATWPAPAICDALGLFASDRHLDLCDSSGLATVFRASRASESQVSFTLLYLRRDLVDRYLGMTNQRLAWAVWGERQFHYEHRPAGVDAVQRMYQHIHRQWLDYAS